MLALLSGARSYRGIITFLEHRRILLNDLFGLNLKRAPALNTLRNVLQAVGSEALEGVFRDHAKDLLVSSKEDNVLAVALDGKVLRGSFDHLNDKKAAQAMMAFASPAAIVLAHTEIAEKSNEIPAAQQMINDLGLTGVVFTADAMHCQKNIPSSQRQR